MPVTPRLLAEAVAHSDFDDYRRLLSDPQVAKTLSVNGKPLPDETVRDFLKQHVDHWQQHGFGLWVFRQKSDGRFVGRGGIKYFEIDQGTVVGLAYAVMPEFWNQGFATEMARPSLETGFGPLGFSEIYGWTLPVNLASQRIMEKLGFRYERDFEYVGLPHRLYCLAADGANAITRQPESQARRD